MYYITQKFCNLIDSDPITEEELIDFASDLKGEKPENVKEAIKIISEKGFDVYECFR